MLRRAAIVGGLALLVGAVIAVVLVAASSSPSRNAGATRPRDPAAVAGARTGAPAIAGAATVGAPGPGVACTQRLDIGASIEDALARATPGSVVCLSGGHWFDPHLSNIHPSANVTLAAAPGQVVDMAGLTIESPGPVGDLTIQGIHFSDEVQGLDAITGGLVFKYDTLEKIPGRYAFYFYGNADGNHAAQSGVSMLHNQIDHAGQCLEIVGGSKLESNFTFSHNVCGPGIGYKENSSFGAHYIQTDGIRTFVVDNNAFEGPPDPLTVTYGNHLNVLHVWGSSQNIDFSNNIVWHVRAIGQMVLIGDNSYPSLLDNITLSNNLDVSDRACGPGSSCQSYSMYSFTAHKMTWTHNTIIGSVWGVGLGWVASCTSMCYRSSTDMTGSYNLAAPSCGSNPKCNQNYAAFDCNAAPCTIGHNVSADASAQAALGGADNVVQWAPNFRTTASWTPNSGSPWSPPPRGYYEPVGLPFGAGYQGPIGP